MSPDPIFKAGEHAIDPGREAYLGVGIADFPESLQRIIDEAYEHGRRDERLNPSAASATVASMSPTETPPAPTPGNPPSPRPNPAPGTPTP